MLGTGSEMIGSIQTCWIRISRVMCAEKVSELWTSSTRAHDVFQSLRITGLNKFPWVALFLIRKKRNKGKHSSPKVSCWGFRSVYISFEQISKGLNILMLFSMALMLISEGWLSEKWRQEYWKSHSVRLIDRFQ